MLSAAAWNALLKTLEEPPPHVKFLFATTEAHKVLPTILSRCQRFDLKRIEASTIAARLRDIADRESVHIDDEAISVDDGSGKATGRGGAVGAWRDAFIGVNVGATNGLGLLSDTFETSITWDKWPEFDAAVRDRVGRVLGEVLGDG